MRKHVPVLFGVVAILLAALPADARGPGKAGRGHCGGAGFGIGPRMQAELGLTQEQQKQITALQEKHWQEAAAQHEQVRVKHEELAALWRTDKPDRAAIHAKLAEIDTIREGLRAAAVDLKLAVHALLTPEQRAKAELGRGCGFGGGQGRGGCPFADGEDRGPKGRGRAL